MSIFKSGQNYNFRDIKVAETVREEGEENPNFFESVALGYKEDQFSRELNLKEKVINDYILENNIDEETADILKTYSNITDKELNKFKEEGKDSLLYNIAIGGGLLNQYVENRNYNAFKNIQQLRENNPDLLTDEQINERVKQEYYKKAKEFEDQQIGLIGGFIGAIGSDLKNAFTDNIVKQGNATEAIINVLPFGTAVKGASITYNALRVGTINAGLSAGTQLYIENNDVKFFQRDVLDNKDYGFSEIAQNTLFAGAAGFVLGAGLFSTGAGVSKIFRKKDDNYINDSVDIIINKNLTEDQITEINTKQFFSNDQIKKMNDNIDTEVNNQLSSIEYTKQNIIEERQRLIEQEKLNLENEEIIFDSIDLDSEKLIDNSIAINTLSEDYADLQINNFQEVISAKKIDLNNAEKEIADFNKSIDKELKSNEKVLSLNNKLLDKEISNLKSINDKIAEYKENTKLKKSDDLNNKLLKKIDQLNNKLLKYDFGKIRRIKEDNKNIKSKINNILEDKKTTEKILTNKVEKIKSKINESNIAIEEIKNKSKTNKENYKTLRKEIDDDINIKVEEFSKKIDNIKNTHNLDDLKNVYKNIKKSINDIKQSPKFKDLDITIKEKIKLKEEEFNTVKKSLEAQAEKTFPSNTNVAKFNRKRFIETGLKNKYKTDNLKEYLNIEKEFIEAEFFNTNNMISKKLIDMKNQLELVELDIYKSDIIVKQKDELKKLLSKFKNKEVNLNEYKKLTTEILDKYNKKLDQYSFNDVSFIEIKELRDNFYNGLRTGNIKATPENLKILKKLNDTDKFTDINSLVDSIKNKAEEVKKQLLIKDRLEESIRTDRYFDIDKYNSELLNDNFKLKMKNILKLNPDFFKNKPNLKKFFNDNKKEFDDLLDTGLTFKEIFERIETRAKDFQKNVNDINIEKVRSEVEKTLYTKPASNVSVNNGLEDFEGLSSNTKQVMKNNENQLSEILKEKDFDYYLEDGTEIKASDYLKEKLDNMENASNVLTCLLS